MATISVHTNHFAIQIIETSINGVLRYDAAHIVRLDKDVFGKGKFSYCICIGYKGNDFIEVEEAALANPALVFDSAEAAHAAALAAVQNIVNSCDMLAHSIGRIFSGNGSHLVNKQNPPSQSRCAGVSPLDAQRAIREALINDMEGIKEKIKQVDTLIAFLEREEAASELRLTRLSAQDFSDFEPEEAARYIPELCEAWLRAMLDMAGIELVNLFRPYEDATDVFKIECACSIDAFRERAHNAGLKPYFTVPIKGTSRSCWLYIQIGKP